MTGPGCRREFDDSRAAADPDRIAAALTYVPTVARRYVGCGLSFDELLSAGNLGLVEAALRFDPHRGVRFVTYADWWIRKSILENLEEQCGPMRLPRYQHERLRQLRSARSDWVAARGREPTREELSRATGVSEVETESLLRHWRSAVSLDEPARPDDDRPIKEALVARDDNPQSSLVRRDLARRVRYHLAFLKPRDREVLSRRFGLDRARPQTLREVGNRVGISRERVRQIEVRALRELRRRL